MGVPLKAMFPDLDIDSDIEGDYNGIAVELEA